VVRVRDCGVTLRLKSGGGGAASTSNATVAECVSDPEVPLNVTVALPTAAFEAAMRVTFSGVPGLRVSAAGDALTPAGRPLIATATGELKPFPPVTIRVTGCPVAPAVSFRLAGTAVRVKSAGGGGADTLSARFALCVSEPDVAVKTTVAFPV